MGGQYEVDLDGACDAPLSGTFINTLNAFNAGLPQASRFQIAFAQNDPIPNLVFTVNSYNAYGNAFQQWMAPGVAGPQVSGMIDVRTNLPAPGVNNTPTYSWINVVTTNCSGVAAAQANALPPFVDVLSGARSPLYPVQDQRGFEDIPTRPNFSNPISWSAETALVLQQGQNITVYPDSFTWGWTTSQRQGGGTPTAGPPGFAGSTNPGTPGVSANLPGTLPPATTPLWAGFLSGVTADQISTITFLSNNIALRQVAVTNTRGLYAGTAWDVPFSFAPDLNNPNAPTVYTITAVFSGDSNFVTVHPAPSSCGGF